MNITQDFPGPGTYQIGNLMGAGGPKRSFGLKINSTEKEMLSKPGPGAYEPK